MFDLQTEWIVRWSEYVNNIVIVPSRLCNAENFPNLLDL